MIQNSNEAFRTVMRGYEPTEVDRRVAELTVAADAAEQQAAELARRVEELTAADVHRYPSAPSFGDLGTRIGQMLTLANEEADELRTAAATEVRRRLLELDAASARTMADAERRAEQVVAEAVARAEQIRSDSQRELAAATQRRDSINVQLANVRQMLATLTGAGTGTGALVRSHSTPSHAGPAGS